MIKYLKYKDYKRRQSLSQKAMLNFIWRSLYKRESYKKNKFKIMLKNQLLYLQIKTKINNRCINSYKMRSVTQISGLTKNSFKSFFDNKNIMGFKKSSW